MNYYFTTNILFHLMFFVYFSAYFSSRQFFGIYETYLCHEFQCNIYLRCSNTMFKNHTTLFLGTTYHLILINADHQDNLGTTNTDYKNQALQTHNIDTLFSISKTHCRKVNNPKKTAHSEIKIPPMCHNFLDCRSVELYLCR